MEIKGKYLKAVSIFSGKDDVRHYLNGVFAEVSDNQLILTATDGHRMISIRLDVESGQRKTKFIIPLTLIKDIKPDLPVFISISDDDSLITIQQDDWKKQSKPIDGIYPDYRRVIPENVSGEPANYNAKYLMDAAKALNILEGKKIENRSIAHNGTSPGIVKTSDKDIIAIIMPIKENEYSYIKPSW